MPAETTNEPANGIERLLSAADTAFRARRMAEVEGYCERIVELDPNHVLALHLLRLAVNAKGDIDHELQILRRILAINPHHPESLNGLGDALRKQGQPLLGIEPCLHAVELRPDYTNARNTLGLCYFETGSLTQAAECFERAIGLQPTLAAAHVNLGATFKKLGRNAEAVDCYRRATQIAPDSSEAQEALGLLYGIQRNPQQAAQCFRRVLRLNPTSTRAHLLLADSLQQQGSSDKAKELVDRALAMSPNSAPAHCMLGFTKVDLGEFDLAIAAFERSIALNPIQADAYLGLVTSRKVTEADRPLVDRMTALLEDPELTPADQAQMRTALGKALDDLGDYGLAIAHVDEANRIALELEGEGLLQENRDAAHVYVAKTIETFTADLYRKDPGFGFPTELPIFITGLPRSGTTLLEQILSSHSKVAGVGEMSFWDNVGMTTPNRLMGLAADKSAARVAAEEYLRGIRKTHPEARFIVNKYNDNIFNVGFLHLVFPNARFIHCRRSPIDNCVSIYMTPFRKRSPAFRVREDILEYYRHFCTLAAHWRQILPADRFLEVDYEESIANHEAVTRRVIAFCDLEWEDACLRHEENKRIVNTPSKWQARQPIYSTSVERWRRYEPWLGAFRELIPDPQEDSRSPTARIAT